MGMVNSTDYKSYGKPLEEELDGGWEAPLPGNASDKENPETKTEE